VKGFNAGSGCLALSDPETPERLAIVAGIALPPGVSAVTWRFGDGVLGWVAKHGRRCSCKGDAQNDPRSGPRRALPRPRCPGRAMCWPVRSEERLIGAVSVNRAVGQPPFSENDLEHGSLVMGLVTVMMENTRLHVEQAQRIDVLSTLNAVMNKINGQLEETQGQLLQSEKMASIGQLAAGVAHEINNPIGYVNPIWAVSRSSCTSSSRCSAAYEKLEDVLPEARRRHSGHQGAGRPGLPARGQFCAARRVPRRHRARQEDRAGPARLLARRLQRRVAPRRSAQGLDSTLNIVNNEIKYKAEVIKEYGQLPEIECLPTQLNQVFLNILMNAAQGDARWRQDHGAHPALRATTYWVRSATPGAASAPTS
jgi:hypothetical protein